MAKVSTKPDATRPTKGGNKSKAYGAIRPPQAVRGTNKMKAGAFVAARAAGLGKRDAASAALSSGDSKEGE